MASTPYLSWSMAIKSLAVSCRNESWGYDEKVFTSVYTYNAAGLVALLEDEHTVTEYTYAWFYDPEGIHKD